MAGHGRAKHTAITGLGLLAGAVLVWTGASGCSEAPHERPTGVVLVLFDTLRADRLAAYGNPRPTSPHFDALAERGALFLHAYSPAPWTLPSMVGLLSGSFPSRRVWSDDTLHRAIPEALRAAGVATAAVTEGGFASARFGLDRGFDYYEEREGAVVLADGPVGAPRGGIRATFDAAESWLRTRGSAGDPFFLLIHTYETHTPYLRRFFTEGMKPGRLGSATLELADQMRLRRGEIELGPVGLDYVAALYDGGVRVADGYLGRLQDLLAELGLADTTAIIVTSDHGEDLGARDPRQAGEHGHSLHDELLRVPLLIHDPTQATAGMRIETQVRTLDVLPTVLDLLGIGSWEDAHDADGRSLLPVIAGEERDDRAAFSQLTRKGRPRAALRDGRFKWISWLDAPGVAARVYDLEADPGEREPLAGELPSDARGVGQRLDTFLAGLEESGRLDFRIEVDELAPELREQLRALGYLDP